MKKIIALILALLLIFSFAACSKGGEDTPAQPSTPSTPNTPATPDPAPSEPAADPKDFKVAVLTGSLTNTPFCVSMGDEINAQFGAEGWDLSVFDADMDATKQSTQFETAIMMEPDVIVYWCRDSAAAVEDVKKASAAGIPVITLNNDILEEGWEHTLCFVGPSQYQIGFDLGTYMVEHADSAKLAIIDGRANNSTYNDRYAGFMDAIEGKPEFEVIAHDYCNADRTTAQTMTENYITGYPELDTLVYFSDNFAIGGINAVTAANKSDDIKVYSIDGMQIGFDAVAAGDMDATVLQTPGYQIARVIEIIKDVVIGGGSVDGHAQYSGHYIIDKDTMGDYKAAY